MFALGLVCFFQFVVLFACFNQNYAWTYICDLLQQNPEQVAWDYFEIQIIEILKAKILSEGQI